MTQYYAYPTPLCAEFRTERLANVKYLIMNLFSLLI